ncbi:MAG TPA: hypothetical protein VMV31_06215 [Terriglobales bacterium]|nr:hypothetical protein [Terriglobales bacterium]
MFRKDFQRLARLRAREARILLRNGCIEGAYYFAGLSIECALKARIAKATCRYGFYDKQYAQKVFTHNLEELLKLADLDRLLQADAKAQPSLAGKWNVLKSWNVESRYQLGGLQGRAMVEAVGNAGGLGLMTWIAQRW